MIYRNLISQTKYIFKKINFEKKIILLKSLVNTLLLTLKKIPKFRDFFKLKARYENVLSRKDL